MASEQELLDRIQHLEQQLANSYPIAPDKSPQELFQIVLFEVLGTALFAYGIISSSGDDFMVSVSLFAGIFIAAQFSGGHLNPAVSFAFYCSNEINTFTLRLYWASQMGGVFLGAFVAKLILDKAASPHIPDQTFDWVLADFMGEVLGTFLFVLFILIQTHQQTQFSDNKVLGIGIIATALYFGRMSTYHSGGCLNPAVGLGLEIVKSLEVGIERLANVWVFLFAPLLGGSFASEFYRNIYLHFYNKN